MAAKEATEESPMSSNDDLGEKTPDELVCGAFKSMGYIVPTINHASNISMPVRDSTELEDFPVTPLYLKECIINPELKARVKPILLSFNGLPRSVKTDALNCIRGSVQGNVKETLFQQVRSELKQPKALGIAFYEIVAARLSMHKEPSINEFTTQSCFAPVILSAFKNELLSANKVPRFRDPSEVLSSSVYLFKQPDLDEHLCFIYQFLSQQDKKLEHSDDTKSKAHSQLLMESLPEGIAIFNIWDVTFTEPVRHFLAALQGHLYNHHMWLFLDLKQDSQNLTKPPETDEKGSSHTTLVKWRPHLHHLLRLCKMSEDKMSERERVCTIFASHDGQYKSEELTGKVKKLEDDVRPVADQIGISSLLNEKIKALNLDAPDDFQGLYQRFQRIISEKPFEDIPIAWIFLRTLFYRFDWKVITRCDLQAMAEKCNIDEESLQKFCKFYMSFGSILDLSLINPNYQYVIVKPIGFLNDLGSLLNPSKEILRKFRTLEFGIVPETACLNLFNGHILAYMDALVSLTLAIRLSKHSIELKEEEHGLLNDDLFYYVPLTRIADADATPDFSSIHIVTSINTPHVFKQVAFTKYFLQLLPESKLIPSKEPNKTIIRDPATGITVTLVSHSPAIRLTLSKPDECICSKIVQAYEKIAESAISRGIAAVNYKFIKVCAKNDPSKFRYISSCLYHMLPDDKLCSKCNEAATGDDVELLQVWNKTLKEHPIKDCFQSTEGLTVLEIAKVAAKIASLASKNVPVHLDAITRAFNYTHDAQDLQADDVTMNRIILSWYDESKKDTQEPRRQLARKIFEVGRQVSQSCESEDEGKKLITEFINMAKNLDVYFDPETLI